MHTMLKCVKATNLIVSGMKCDGGDKVNVLEAAQAFSPGHVPQAHGLVHRRREQEVVLRPANVQHVRRVASEATERPSVEDGGPVHAFCTTKIAAHVVQHIFVGGLPGDHLGGVVAGRGRGRRLVFSRVIS